VKSLSLHILQQIVSSNSEGILLVDARDPKLPIVYANPAYEELSGYCTDELIGSGWRLAEDDEEPSAERVRLREAIDCGDPCELTIADLRKDGTSWLSHLNVRPIDDTQGNFRYVLCQQRLAAAEQPSTSSVEVDLLQRELGHARQEIASLSQTDSVTGLLNYEYFMSLLRRDLAVDRRERRTLHMLTFEIVELDVYRRTFGPQAADSCVRMIAAQVAGAFRRAGDICGRWDASTIVVAARGHDESQVAFLAERVVDKVKRLGLHNPRARSGKYLVVRSAISESAPGAYDADTLVDCAKAKLGVGVIGRQQANY